MFKQSQATLARFTALAVLVASAAVAARAEWSPWVQVPNGAGIEVSFRQVNEFVCTWKFRNNGTGTLRSFEYNYTFVPATPPTTLSPFKVTRFDELDQPLKRGRSAGETLEFSAETTNCPANVSVQHIAWDRD
jgi:hypothetical protein